MLKTIKLFAFIGAILFSYAAFTQNLSRRPMLGLLLSPVTEEMAMENNFKGKEGAYVRSVIPNSTAEALKLREKDIITHFNGIRVKNPDELIAISRELKTGESIHLVLARQGKKLSLKGNLGPMPEERSGSAKVVYDEVKIASGYSRCIIRVPDNQKGKHPAIFYIPGFGCGTTDFAFPMSSEKNLIDAFVKNGYAVFTIEKPGIGDSKGSRHCHEIGFWEQMEVYKDGFRKLESYPYIDRDNIILFGHSLGGSIAPLLAEEFRVKAMAVFGVVGKPWIEYLYDIFRDQRLLAHTDPLKIEEEMRTMMPLLHEFIVHKKSPKEMALENPDYKVHFEENLEADMERETVFGRHYTFTQELNDMNLAKALKNAAVPLLAIFGEADLAAINESGAKTMADIVNHYHPGKGTYLFIPETDHGMMKIGSMEDYVQVNIFGKKPDKEPEFNQEVPKKVLEWLESIR